MTEQTVNNEVNIKTTSPVCFKSLENVANQWNTSNLTILSWIMKLFRLKLFQ